MPGNPIDDDELRGPTDRDMDLESDLDHEADDREHLVAHRPNPLPSREEDEEELAEADILEELDLDDFDDDDDMFRRA